MQPCLFSQENNSDKKFSDYVNTNRFTLRHIESKGIGYNQGYTTLEAFFTPMSTLQGRWIPFFDGRAHIFNNGKPAANVGTGLRYLNTRIWGANIYYDFRKTSKLNYSQISGGLETIGEKVDARITGYFPVGKHTSTRGSTTFDYFKGNHMYLAKKEEYALQGVNAELGIHLGRSKKMSFYTAFGPYYFLNNCHEAIGGSVRVVMGIKDALTLEANTSYDTLFHFIGQGQISLSYAFKPKRFDRLRGKKSRTRAFDIRSRVLQKVDKFEIIVTDFKKQKSLAINPATGQPYYFLFVDPTQTENGIGTFESPFNSLDHIESLPSITIDLSENIPVPLIIKPESVSLPSVDAEVPSPEIPAVEFIMPTELVDAPSIDLPSIPLPLKPTIDSSSLTVTNSAFTPLAPVISKSEEILLIPGKGQEIQTTLGTVMVPASQKGHPKITHVKDVEYQGKKTHVFVITMEDDSE